MPTGTVKAVKNQRSWSGQYGDFIDYVIDLESGGKTGEVYITRKPESPAPSIGETFDYTVAKKDNHGIKIKKVDPNGAGPSSNGGGNYSSGGGNDDRQESIERQTAAKVAGEILHGAGPNMTASMFTTVADIAHGWIKGGVKEAPAQSLPPQNDPGPVDTSGFDGPATTGGGQGTPDDDIPFAASKI